MEGQENKNSIGTLIGIIIVILMLIIGAFYFYNQRIEKQKEIKKIVEQQQELTVEDVASIENAVNSLKFDNLGEGIDQI